MPLVHAPPSASPSGPPEIASTKTSPPFASCTRSAFSAGLTDWLQITSPRLYPNFDICPDCYNTPIKPTQYAKFITPSGPKPEGTAVRCDFSDLWMRVAWAWLYMHDAPDLSLLGTLSELQDAEGPCPNLDLENEEIKKGKKPSATRTWYCVQDPRGGGLVEEMTVCSHCVTHIYTICPNLQGIFVAAAGGQNALATCDLMLPSQERTIKYIDQFLDVAEATMSKGYRDVAPLAAYIRKWAPIPTCPKWEKTQEQTCYSLPSVVPEWTICEECYLEHIQPLHQKTPQPLVLSQISAQSATMPGGFTCQLYSARLQQYWQDALGSNDLQSLRQKIRARNEKLVEVKQRLEQMKMQYQQQKMQADFHMQMMQIEQSSAMSQSLANTMSGWYTPAATETALTQRQIDWRASNAQMSQGSQLKMQASMTLANIQMVEKEWADFWE